MSGSSAGSVISGVATLIGAAATGYAAVKGASTPKIKEPKAPVISKPAEAPDKDSAEVLKAKREQQLLMARNNSGRQSTILTETLG